MRMHYTGFEKATCLLLLLLAVGISAKDLQLRRKAGSSNDEEFKMKYLLELADNGAPISEHLYTEKEFESMEVSGEKSKNIKVSGVKARKTSFSYSFDRPSGAQLNIEVITFLSTGNISRQVSLRNQKNYLVTNGDVQLNIDLRNWKLCGKSKEICSHRGKSVKIRFAVKGQPEAVNIKKPLENHLIEPGTNRSPLYINVFTDGVLGGLDTPYPVVRRTTEGRNLDVTIQISKFGHLNKQLAVLPIIGFITDVFELMNGALDGDDTVSDYAKRNKQVTCMPKEHGFTCTLSVRLNMTKGKCACETYPAFTNTSCLCTTSVGETANSCTTYRTTTEACPCSSTVIETTNWCTCVASSGRQGICYGEGGEGGASWYDFTGLPGSAVYAIVSVLGTVVLSIFWVGIKKCCC